jgi:hypothetical protein
MRTATKVAKHILVFIRHLVVVKYTRFEIGSAAVTNYTGRQI